jgi:hypothetical protein
MCKYRQLVAGLPLHAVRVAGHHHPLEVDGLGPAILGLLQQSSCSPHAYVPQGIPTLTVKRKVFEDLFKRRKKKEPFPLLK